MFSRRAVTSVVRAARSVRQASASASAAPVAKGPSEEIIKLQEKAKLPWGQLSVEEKKALYRSAYGQTRKELQAGDGDTGKVLIGVGVALAVSYILFTGISSMGAYGGKPDPEAPPFDRKNYNEQEHLKSITSRKPQ